MRARGAWIVLALITTATVASAGCGPGGHRAAPPPTPPPTGPAGASDADAAPSPPDPLRVPDPPPGPISADECGDLVDRVLAIGLAEQRARDPKTPQATPEQQATIRARLLAAAEPTCATMPRARFECAMAARDRAAMTACETAAP